MRIWSSLLIGDLPLPVGLPSLVPRFGRGNCVTCQHKQYDRVMTEPRWLDETEARVWRAYLATQRDLVATLSRRLVQDSGLSGAEYELLVPLSEAPEGLLRARELGALVGWERSRLSHQLRRMETRRLVERIASKTDGRASVDWCGRQPTIMNSGAASGGGGRKT